MVHYSGHDSYEGWFQHMVDAGDASHAKARFNTDQQCRRNQLGRIQKMRNIKKLSTHQLRLLVTVGVGVALMSTAALIITQAPDNTVLQPVSEQKSAPRYMKNPAGGTPLSTLEVLPTTPIADLPTADEPLKAMMREEAGSKEGTGTKEERNTALPVPSVAPVLTAAPPAAESVTPPAPKPRPPKKEKPPLTDVEADNAAPPAALAAKPALRRDPSPQQVFTVEEALEPQVVVQPPKKPQAPAAQRVDNPWDTPGDAGWFNQK